MKLLGFRKENVEIEFDGTYSDLIDKIFQDIFKVSLNNSDNIFINNEIIEFQRDISLHGTPYYETYKSIKKELNYEKFELAIKLINIYNDLKKYKGK